MINPLKGRLWFVVLQTLLVSALVYLSAPLPVPQLGREDVGEQAEAFGDPTFPMSVDNNQSRPWARAYTIYDKKPSYTTTAPLAFGPKSTRADLLTGLAHRSTPVPNVCKRLDDRLFNELLGDESPATAPAIPAEYEADPLRRVSRDWRNINADRAVSILRAQLVSTTRRRRFHLQLISNKSPPTGPRGLSPRRWPQALDRFA